MATTEPHTTIDPHPTSATTNHPGPRRRARRDSIGVVWIGLVVVVALGALWGSTDRDPRSVRATTDVTASPAPTVVAEVPSRSDAARQRGRDVSEELDARVTTGATMIASEWRRATKGELLLDPPTGLLGPGPDRAVPGGRRLGGVHVVRDPAHRSRQRHRPRGRHGRGDVARRGPVPTGTPDVPAPPRCVRVGLLEGLRDASASTYGIVSRSEGGVSGTPMVNTPLEEAQGMLALAQAIGGRVRENDQVIMDMSTQLSRGAQNGPRGLRRGVLRCDR